MFKKNISKPTIFLALSIAIVIMIAYNFYTPPSEPIPNGNGNGNGHLPQLSLLRKVSGSPYFVNEEGDAVYLSGSDGTIDDSGDSYPPEVEEFWMPSEDHNFMRLWRWELFNYKYGAFPSLRYIEPHPWERSGGGEALDGRPKYDLTDFNEAYFDRLRERVMEADKKGIYVSIMLFEGHGPQFSSDPWCWDGHPFNKRNNINNVGINVDESDGRGTEIHMLVDPSVTAIQEAYLRKLIDTVNDLDNVLYEVANEAGVYSTEWQYHIINYVHNYENSKPKQHPIGMSFQWKGGGYSELINSPADWISPSGPNYQDGLRIADGKKVVILDTDHLWGGRMVANGIELNRKFVWKNFCRGFSISLLDYQRGELNDIRASMEYTVDYSERIDLNNAVFSFTNFLLSDEAYFIINEGREYLIYLPDGGSCSVDLSKASGTLNVEWFNPATGNVIGGVSTVSGGGLSTFTPPFNGDAVLFVWK